MDSIDSRPPSGRGGRGRVCGIAGDVDERRGGNLGEECGDFGPRPARGGSQLSDQAGVKWVGGCSEGSRGLWRGWDAAAPLRLAARAW